jgi:AcrR family transcriptional regulator
MQSKERILQEAQQLFLHSGPKSMSMDHVASSLGMSKKTLYKWFRNKEALVHSVLNDYLNKLIGALPEPHEHANAVDELARLSDCQFTRVHSSIFYDLKKYYPESWTLWLEFKQNYLLQRIKLNMQRGVAEGVYQPDVDVDVLAHLCLAELELAFDAVAFPHTCFALPRVQVACLRHFLTGIVTAQGLQQLQATRLL